MNSAKNSDFESLNKLKLDVDIAKNERNTLLMRPKFLRELLKQNSDEIDDLKKSVEILTQLFDASYNVSSKKSFNKVVDVSKAFCNEGAPHMNISRLTALFNSKPKFA